MWPGRLALLLALFSLSGMDRAFVQGYAWFTMIQDRSTEMGVEAAIQETLSGENPCQICEAILENSNRSAGDSPLRESCENFVKLYSPWLATNSLKATPPNGTGQLIPLAVPDKRSIYIELPTPPPRWV